VSTSPSTRPSTIWRDAFDVFDALMERTPEERASEMAGLAQLRPELHRCVLMLARGQESAGAQFMTDGGAPQPLGEDAGPVVNEGDMVGAFRLERRLGSGGMGAVWLARRADGVFEAPVALKLMHGHLVRTEIRGRFVREGRILGQLSHPNIARLLDAGVTAEGQLYLALEYVDGTHLDRWCEERQLDIPSRVKLFLQVCAAVSHAHSHLVVHRDLKPSNTLVTQEGQVKLLDFGIAKLVETEEGAGETEFTRLGGRVLTPEYAAPEQITGAPVTVATDVYSLGVLLYRLLSGQRPYGKPGQGLRELESEVLTAVPPSLARGSDTRKLRSTLSGDLDTVVLKALKKKPTERYPSVADLADDLLRWMEHRPIQARPDSWTYRTTRFIGRYRVLVGAAAAVIVSLTVGLVIALWQAKAAVEAGNEATARRRQAEDLIGFMLGDLREQLIQVGRLDALDATMAKVSEYVRAEQGTVADADALAQRSSVLTGIVRTERERGRLPQAAAAVDEALRVARQLVATEPGERAEVALAEALVADALVASSNADPGKMYMSANEGLALVRPRHRDRPDDIVLARLVAELDSLAAVGIGDQRPDEAKALLRECFESLKFAEENREAPSRLMRSSMDCRAGLLYQSETADDAAALVSFAQRATQRFPKDLALQRDAQQALASAASVLVSTRRYDDAAVALEIAVPLGRRLLDLDPGNVKLVQNFANALSSAQVLATARGSWSDAQAVGEEALAVLGRHSTGLFGVRYWLIIIRADRAALFFKSGKGNEAVEKELEAGISLWREDEGRPDIIENMLFLRLRQWLYSHEKRPATADAALKSIRDLRSRLESQSHTPYTEVLGAEADYVEGRIERADRVLLERLVADGAQIPDFEEFRDAACRIRVASGGGPCPALPALPSRAGGSSKI
jgi:tetratricopeptide (TPR) repeat protein